MEQVRGIEPPYSAWEADILPMNYTCIFYIITLIEEKSKPLFGNFFRQQSGTCDGEGLRCRCPDHYSRRQIRPLAPSLMIFARASLIL